MTFTTAQAADPAALAPTADPAVPSTTTTPATPPTAPGTPVVPAAHNQVFLVAGERAFTDAASVVKHVEHSQSHIQTLEAERNADRVKLDEQDKELQRLRTIEASLEVGQAQDRTVPQTEQLSTEQLAAQAAQVAVGLIEESSNKATQQNNLATLEAQAKAAYGDEYAAKVVAIGQELGMSPQAIDALGSTSPDAFSRLFLPSTGVSQSLQPSTGTLATGGPAIAAAPVAVNLSKMKEKERLVTVAERMKAAGVSGY